MKKASIYAGFLIFFGLSWMALENKMVEAAGIEPASGNSPRRITTCLALFFVWPLEGERTHPFRREPGFVSLAEPRRVPEAILSSRRLRTRTGTGTGRR